MIRNPMLRDDNDRSCATVTKKVSHDKLFVKSNLLRYKPHNKSM